MAPSFLRTPLFLPHPPSPFWHILLAAGPIVKRTLRLRLRLAFISPFPPQHHPTQQSGNGSSDLEAVGLLRFLLTAIYLEPELLYMCTVVRPIFKTRARPVDLPRAVTGDDFALFRFCFPSTARLLPRSHSLFVAAPGSFCSPVFVLPFFIHSPSLSSCFSRISVTMVTHHDLLFHFLPRRPFAAKPLGYKTRTQLRATQRTPHPTPPTGTAGACWRRECTGGCWGDAARSSART